MMHSNTMYAFVWSIFFAELVTAGPGYSMQCCDIALQTLAYLNKSIPYDNYKCGQVYQATLPPAPPLLVSTSWCRQKCPGYALSAPSDTSAWAVPLVQYILPAVIFSMTIPRRLVLEPPRWFFDFNVNHMSGLIKALFSLSVAGMIVTVDTAVWVFIIMVAPAPFIFSGLVEIVLDYRVIRNLMCSYTEQGKDQPVGLDRGERVQLLTAVLAGNLGIEGVPVEPQEELGRVLDINKHPKEVEIRLGAMLACQYPFGAAVGAPILLYIGSFVYTLATIRNDDGDRETARALAFGIWWMNIVHVSAISGCLLASNNPNTAAAIVKLERKKVGLQGRLGFANKRPEMEDKIQAQLEAWSRLPLTYKARYEPVWMWTRGKSKAGWLRRTSAWRKTWFREKVEMTVPGWISLAFVAFSLVVFPCALAFWIEYATPARGVGCRSLTILVYASSQLTFTVLSAWSHFKASKDQNYWEAHRWLGRLRRTWVGVSVAVIFLIPAWVAAVFTTFAGTLMQITGIYQNCLCASSGYWSFGSTATVQLAADTEADRNASMHWQKAGYTALIFLAVVTYLGWWCQCYLREKFIERVKHLVAKNLTGNHSPTKEQVELIRQQTAETAKSSEISTLCDMNVSSV